MSSVISESRGDTTVERLKEYEGQLKSIHSELEGLDPYWGDAKIDQHSDTAKQGYVLEHIHFVVHH